VLRRHHLKKLRPDDQFENIVVYFALLSLSDYSLLKFYPSALSAASVLLGGVMLGKEPTWLLANVSDAGRQPQASGPCFVK